jgi:flavin-dependent dehydrogenase
MNAPAPIEILGGGLAGLALGLALRREGVPVTIFEAGDYPRHRVCGEFITGLSPATIARLGLAPFLRDALQHRAVAWFLHDESAQAQTLPSPALGLSRHALDARLADAFVAAGGELRTGTRVTDLAAKPGRIFATGRRRGRSPWLGLKFHVRGLVLVRDLELHLGDHAYVGLSRVEDGAVNVCGLFRQRTLAARGPQLLLGYLRAAGLLALGERLATAEIDAGSFCAVAALAFDRASAAAVPDRIQLGDACAMIPPFTGNGMAMAFQSAEAALDPLLRYARGEIDWAASCCATNAALRGRFRLRLASADVLHPFLLRPRRQRWLAALNRSRLLPLGPLYAALH